MDGALVVDKPAGLGSTDVVRVVRRAARQRRVGHTGTLDPDATGVLVVCLGRATRLVRFLQEGSKTYRAWVRFGIETTTQDASGEVVAERSTRGVEEPDVRAALTRFVGDIEQVPPMVSAVKVGGERLYEKARRGEEVERAPRRVTVHDLALEGFRPGDAATAELVVTCSAGTYVRTLAHDLGQLLGYGASLTALRRTRNGAFTEADAHPLDEIERRGVDGTLDEVLLSPLEALRGLPRVEADPDEAAFAASGRPLPSRGREGAFALARGGELLAVYAERDDRALPEAVFVQPADL